MPSPQLHNRSLRVSHMAQELIGSEILKISAEIARMQAQGIKVANYTVGDFNPTDFPIPEALRQLIIQYYQQGATNYPPAMGTNELRQSVSQFYKQALGADYSTSEILVAGGARPLIYASYLTLLDPGDVVIYGVPSWNNNHYAHMVGALPVQLQMDPSTNFQLSAAAIAPELGRAQLVVLCSPSNPAGTLIEREALHAICELIVHENKSRTQRGAKPCYLLYDQIYWTQTHGQPHHHPLALVPDIKPFLLYVDGISKSFAATGLRVGWAAGPEDVMGRMSAVLGHIGAWAPKPEQLAVADYLQQYAEVQRFITHMSGKLAERLHTLYRGFEQMRSQGLPVQCMAPQGGMYLAVSFNLMGWITEGGKTLTTTEDIRSYLLEDARCGLVPFQAFGVRENTTWFRISVGAIAEADITRNLAQIEASLRKLKSL